MRQEWKLKELTVKAYEAETKRITALGTGMTPEQVQALVMQTLQDTLMTPSPGAGLQEEAQEIEQEEMQTEQQEQAPGMQAMQQGMPEAAPQEQMAMPEQPMPEQAPPMQ